METENIELLDKAISNINYVRNLIYKEQWENAELLFEALNALGKIKYNLENTEDK